MRQGRSGGNEELLEQYWNYTYDILERYSLCLAFLELVITVPLYWTEHPMSSADSLFASKIRIN